MFVAKITAAIGLILFLAGVAGVGGSGLIAVGCLLLLVAAVTGAVVLEGRDLDPAAALLPSEFHDDPAGEVAPTAPVQLPTAA